MAQTVLDRGIQIHGAGGFTEDCFMAEACSYARRCHQTDAPDQGHMMALAKEIIARHSACGSSCAALAGQLLPV